MHQLSSQFVCLVFLNGSFALSAEARRTNKKLNFGGLQPVARKLEMQIIYELSPDKLRCANLINDSNLIVN